jgi:acetyl esterase/lipase
MKAILSVLVISAALAACGGDSVDAGLSTSSTSVIADTTADTTDTSVATTQSATCRDVATGPLTFVYVTRQGVDPALTSLDVYLPAGCDPVPIVVWVHGGAWRAGDKRDRGVAEKVTLANGLGAALVAVNYRLSTPGSGVLWPDHGLDLVAALAWLRDIGPEHGLDPGTVVLIGHSAGAHLVSIVATDPDLLAVEGIDPSMVDCVVALDTEGFDLAKSAASDVGIVADVFGSDPEVIADASPIVQVERHGPPNAEFFVVTRGTVQRHEIALAFVAAMRAGGGTAVLIDAGTYTHNQVNLRLGEVNEQVVTPPVTRFLEGCLAG